MLIEIEQEEYDRLLESEMILDALVENGVDNWSGYKDAMNLVDF